MKFIFFSIIAVLALVASVVAFRITDSSVPSAAGQGEAPIKEINVKTIDVLMARNNIPVGTIITSSMIDKQPWPENLVLDNFVLGDKGGQDIIGTVARSSINAHEPFMKSKLANPNDPGFLAAGLPSGMRAISIATDTVTGIAGFIFPGDRVDILYTHDASASNASISEGKRSSGKPEITEVLGSNIRVLAINLREGDPTKPAPVAPTSITLEVSDSLAQLVRLAEKNGTLSFSLRSIHDDNTNTPAPSSMSDLSHSTDLIIVRGPGSAGGRITETSALSGDINDSLATINAAGGNNPAQSGVNAPAANPAMRTDVPVNNGVNNQINNTNK
jgi:pilus assembly protein CpaB